MSLYTLTCFIFFTSISCVSAGLNAYTQALRDRFEASFQEKCYKYPFIKQWEYKLENTDDRYVTFIYQEPRLRNGGLGDRVAGLLNAVAIALRTNRTLLIESQNNFHELFQPFHSQLLLKNNDQKSALKKQFTWRKENWTEWSNWSRRFVDNDATEYDMWFCVNNVAWRNKICGMDDSDVPQPHIKLRGNRAYFCKWASHPGIAAHKDFLRVIAPAGVDSYDSINLMEVAGCMTRLAMWPTEYLWQFVSDSLSTHMAAALTTQRNKLQIGAHFRCGDLSYIKGQDKLCIHDVDGLHPHEESSYMGAGNPFQIGKCVADLVANYSTGFVETRLSEAIVRTHQQQSAHKSATSMRFRRNLREREKDKTAARLSPLNPQSIDRQKDVVLYVASDNMGSAQQINSTANLPLTIVSPKGCHVEMDPSFACSKLTVGYWLILALSDVIVTQTDLTGSPISAFSRYAAVYGLKGDSLRDARDCSNPKAFYDIGRRWTGNWFCD